MGGVIYFYQLILHSFYTALLLKLFKLNRNSFPQEQRAASGPDKQPSSLLSVSIGFYIPGCLFWSQLGPSQLFVILGIFLLWL